MSDDHDQVTDQSTTHRRAVPVDDGPEAAPTDLAATLGNRGVARVLRDTEVQRAGATARQELDEAVARSIEQRRGSGRPLDEDVRTDMEGALGADLDGVRVHTDSSADELNQAVSAKAFTSGDDVFFRTGSYDPGSSSGRELLAHELTHVVQQRTGTSGLAAGEVSDPSDGAEIEAAAVGAEVAAGTTASGPAVSAAPAVARDGMEEDELQMAVARQPEEEELQMAVARQPEEEELQMAVARQPEEEELMMAREDVEEEEGLQRSVARQGMEDEDELLQG